MQISSDGSVPANGSKSNSRYVSCLGCSAIQLKLQSLLLLYIYFQAINTLKSGMRIGTF